MENVNPILDPTSPYFVHLNDQNIDSNILVYVVLSGRNYYTWASAMRNALSSRNKMQFVDGSLPCPVAEDPLRSAWERCNALVLSWIANSLDPAIARSVFWMDTAAEVWSHLKEVYGGILHISEILEEFYTKKQGELSITAYFAQLKSLWLELENSRPIPSCTCAIPCSCEMIPLMKKYRQTDFIIRFLNGLNKQYSFMRSQILLQDSLPSINKVFSMMIQLEGLLSISLKEPRGLANMVEGSNLASRGRRTVFNQSLSKPQYHNSSQRHTKN